MYHTRDMAVLFFSMNAQTVATFLLQVTSTYFLRVVTITTVLYHVAEKL